MRDYCRASWLGFLSIALVLPISSIQANSCLPDQALLINDNYYQTKLLSQATLQQGQTIGKLILAYPGIDNAQLIEASKPSFVGEILTKLPANQTIYAVQNRHTCQLENIQIPINLDTRLTLIKDAKSFHFVPFKRLQQVTDVYKHFSIENSLFVDGKKQNIPNTILAQIELILASQFDFQRDLRQGDQFSLMYEQPIHHSGQHQVGPLLMVEYLRNNGQRIRLYRYQLDTEIAYVNDSGYSSKHSFLRNPLKSARISSNFNPRRFHPILNKVKAHKGTDFAAPVGTPIRATANGEIIQIGWINGYGKTIKLKHGHKYQTLYAHLSRYYKGLKKGSRVRKGQTIGYVGTTGRVTGPHLHYEFIVDGRHQDPMKVSLPSVKLSEQELTQFQHHRQQYQKRFNQLKSAILVAISP